MIINSPKKTTCTKFFSNIKFEMIQLGATRLFSSTNSYPTRARGISVKYQVVQKPTILDRIKREIRPPPRPESMMNRRKNQNAPIFPSLKWGGGVVLIFHLNCPRFNLGKNKKRN